MINQYHGILVASERRKAKVPYPAAYAYGKEAETDIAKYRFNCAQRAHQNYLENMPTMVVTAAIGGLTYPVATAALGALWSVGRIIYAKGYINSTIEQKGNGRYKGTWYLLGQVGLYGIAGYTVYNLIRA